MRWFSDIMKSIKNLSSKNPPVSEMDEKYLSEQPFLILSEARDALQAGENDQAEALLLSLRHHPEFSIEVNSGLALINFQRKDLKKFSAFASRAKALGGHLDDAYYYVGLGKEILRRLDDAERAYVTACNINPSHQAAWDAVRRVRHELSKR